MPNLFALPGPRSGALNFEARVDLAAGSNTVIEPGTTSYAALFTMYSSDHNFVSFSNHGTLWNIVQSGVVGVVGGFYIVDFLNTGLMVAESGDGDAQTVWNGGGAPARSITNTGSIYAIGNGQPVAITHYNPEVVIRNSGLIAAYAPAANSGGVVGAIGIATFNGGNLFNMAGGSILAEGVNATGVLYGRGSFGATLIRNDGQIEALSTGSGSSSIGISAGGLSVEVITFVNSGLLKADRAWSSYDPHPIYGAAARDLLTNEAGGRIVGQILTGRGDDVLLNRGSIVGDIALGDDNDLFDTSGGQFVGVADLGWGDDRFVGSSGIDVVKGGRGNDDMTGGAGDDLLLGGIGADQIEGGEGNDGLYGELGNDRIVTRGGDRVYGGDGEDLIAASDLTFALISGGAGSDLLRLNVGAIRLDLSAAIASGRLEGIENIGLGVDQQLAIRSGDAAALAGGTLFVAGSGASHVFLVGSWTEGAPVVRDGAPARSFTMGAETILVAAAVVVDVQALAPTGFTGLDPVAIGAAAPSAGSIPGADLANPVQTITNLHLLSNITVDAGETWKSTDKAILYGDLQAFGLINAGLIEMTSNAPESAFYAVSNAVGFIRNSGVIRAIGNMSPGAISISGNLQNSGIVESITERGSTTAANVGGRPGQFCIDNSGIVYARALLGAAIAVQAGGGPNVNSGRIEAYGGAGTTAIKILGTGTFINSGTIIASNGAASGAADATALFLWNGGYGPLYGGPANQVINSGSIVGVVAIRSESGNDYILNIGRIEGRIDLGIADDVLENAGIIVGRADLGDGTDAYFGFAAQAAVDVSGGAGDDGLIGGAFGDRLEGGAGNDMIVGGGGADVLVGGAGADRFVYSSVSESTVAASDAILDFVSGVDRIDLGALAPSSLTLSVSGDVTTLTASTAGGPLTIRITGTITLADIDTAPRSTAGSSGSDVLMGTSGNDRLDGGAGADILYGGDGDDIYVVDDPLDRVIERVGGGVDRILVSAEYTLPDNVENATLLAPTTVNGNALDNELRGSAGADTLFSGDGNDVLIGGGGADYLSGGEGRDRFVYESWTDSTATARDTISGFDYGIDKIDLSAIPVLSISFRRVQDMFNSYEDATILTANGTMSIRVYILNIATSGLRQSDFILAPTPPKAPTIPIGDFNGDGRSDILLRDASGEVSVRRGQPDGSSVETPGLKANTIDATWKIAGVGDFNGDGRDDILWRHASGVIGEWLGQTVQFTNNSGVAANAVDNSWSVVGIADYNGDGRDDILWRHSSGEIGQWLAQASGGFINNGGAAANLVDPSWTIVANGDFDGDGRADILWRHTSGVYAEWLGSASGKLSNVGPALNGETGAVVAVGDFDGDGRDDALTRSAASGILTLWSGRSQGPLTASIPSAQVTDLNWKIVGTGDFNGDGRDDLIWQHSSGASVEWLGLAGGDFVNNGTIANLASASAGQSSDILLG
jgi:Ca2+-binding RTX toxin-like protein